ncbi:hypothetical protein BaRGS_00017227 [Batillaria attramentaria]|uniref:RRM domain-containing protein n=1 Tax=Batillaria attramentaria TaxID=370345 RepID=A0ABD0KPY0_9CAEN
MAADSRLFVGGLADQVTEDLLYELFLQVGPLEEVTRPKKRNGTPAKFAFVEFVHPESVKYAIQVMDGIRLFGEHLQLKVSGAGDVLHSSSRSPSHSRSRKSRSSSPHSQSRSRSSSSGSKPDSRSSRSHHSQHGSHQNERKRRLPLSLPLQIPRSSLAGGGPSRGRGKRQMRIPYNGPVDLPSMPFSMTSRIKGECSSNNRRSILPHGPRGGFNNSDHTHGSSNSGYTHQTMQNQQWYPGSQQQQFH